MSAQVFDNAMTAHVWAQQRQHSGRSHNGNFYFEGTRIYSYGGHFVAGLALPGRKFAVNANGYSMTTNGKHMPAVRRAVSYVYFSFPDLTDIADSLEAFAKWQAGERTAPQPHARTQLSAYLAKRFASLDDDSAQYVYSLLHPGRSWQTFKARAQSKAEKAARASSAAARRADRRAAAELASVPLALVRERSWKQADSYGQRNLRETLKDWRTAHLAAGGPRIKAAVWQRIKLARAILKAAEAGSDRSGNTSDSVKARALISNLRRLRMADFKLSYAADNREPLAACQSIPALEMLQDSALMLTRYAKRMPAGTRERLLQLHEYGKAGVRFIEGEHANAERKRRAREDLKRTVKELAHRAKGPPVPELIAHKASYWERYATLIADFRAAGRFSAMASRLESLLPEIEARADAARSEYEREQAAARAERERLAALPADEKRAMWRAGGAIPLEMVRAASYETGPLLRANGAEVSGCTITAGELETSEGAKVPLRHAFAVFAFVRDCRAAGLPWLPVGPSSLADRNWSHARHGPSRIRVGHFQVDSIDACGDFVAGCHSIKWAEVERLANELGVFDCEAETISESVA